MSRIGKVSKLKLKLLKVKKDIDVLNCLNNIGFKPILSLNNMEIFKKYQILAARRQNTRYGEKILLELEDYSFFLPSKYNELKDEFLTRITTQQNFYVHKEDSDSGKLKFTQVIENSYNNNNNTNNLNNNDDEDDDEDVDIF